MDTQTAKANVGQVVQDKLGGGIFGALEYVTPDGWAGVRGPKLPGTNQGRLDEVQVDRLEFDPT